MDPALNMVSKSDSDKPKFSISNVGEYLRLSLTGFVFVNK
jgi:hypothetical protein